MLNNATIQKIEKFVSQYPRSVQEIAEHLNKNWRTADRYIKEIEEEAGTISTRTFREGTRGALKIVYLLNPDKISSSKFQEELEERILRLRRKEEFSAFDIFQYVPEKNKLAIVEDEISEESTNLQELISILDSTEKELKLFSGNLSWINLKKGKIDLFQTLEKLVKKGIRVKVLCRVDLDGVENIKKVLQLNTKYGKELIEIRHREHPIRAFVIDNKSIRLKEIKSPTGKIKELDKKKFIFYTIRDKEWTEWLSKIFLKMFNTSIGSDKRIEELNKLLKK
jgi:DNA-binding transcriptional ArsR family regulator